MAKKEKSVDLTNQINATTGGGDYFNTNNPQQWASSTAGYSTTSVPNSYPAYQYPTYIPTNPNEQVENKLDQLIALMIEMTQRLDDLVALLES